MPRLWKATIEAHGRAVRETTLDVTGALVAEHGPLSVTMSQIAERAGIARATLYKYFPDVESILIAWHERHVAGHLARLVEVRDATQDPARRLEAVLEAYALIAHEHHGKDHGHEPATVLHRGDHVLEAELQIRGLVRELLVDIARTGELRGDVGPDELAGYCVHALTAAEDLSSPAAVRRLVGIVLAGLRPPG